VRAIIDNLEEVSCKSVTVVAEAVVVVVAEIIVVKLIDDGEGFCSVRC
jgi:hypothetical protein